MRNYKPLTEEEIAKYKAMLKEPSEEPPYYQHFIINGKDGKDVNKYEGDDLSPDEEWRQIERIFDECGVRLFVSNYGRIKRKEKIETPTPIWDADGLFIQGYSVYISPSTSPEYLHRLVLEAFDPIVMKGEKYEGHHLNNNAHYNCIKNLIWVTVEDHRKIDTDFNNKITEIHNKIREKTK